MGIDEDPDLDTLTPELLVEVPQPGSPRSEVSTPSYESFFEWTPAELSAVVGLEDLSEISSLAEQTPEEVFVAKGVPRLEGFVPPQQPESDRCVASLLEASLEVWEWEWEDAPPLPFRRPSKCDKHLEVWLHNGPWFDPGPERQFVKFWIVVL